MKILHTSDWHLDHTLYNRRRGDEFTAFLDWLSEKICDEDVDVLLVCGDIFNTRGPSVSAQKMYFDFLKRVHECRSLGRSRCEHVVIIAGNHDSPSFLAAPSDVLHILNVYVITSTLDDPPNDAVTDEAAKCVLLLENKEKTEAAIVVAVPFLPAREVTSSLDGESSEEKNRSIQLGVAALYARLLARARQLREKVAENYAHKIPIVATGHLYTQGGKSGLEDHLGVVNGFRELYIGNLGHFPADGFPDGYDYVALGHLHVPQSVGNFAHIRYSGSPFPINFSEAKQQKEVVLIDFNDTAVAQIECCPVPVFQALRQVRGNLSEIEAEIKNLVSENSTAWLEVLYESESLASDLELKIKDWTHHSNLTVLSVQNRATAAKAGTVFQPGETLETLDAETIFLRLLAQKNTDDSRREQFLKDFREILSEITHGE